MFVLLPSWGLSNAAATLVGQNLGAQKSDRAEQSVWRAAMYNMLLLAAVGVVFVALSPAIVAAFTDDPAVAPLATTGLRIISAGFPFYASGYVLTQAFNGAGDTITPTLLNVACLWFIEIPLAYILARTFGFGPSGVFWSISVAFTVMSIASALVFRRGRWKLKRV
jgi:Na+-driven multidrug efflux pump